MSAETVFHKNTLTDKTILSSISLVVIISNSFEIAHIYKKKNSKNSYEVLLISLSACDALFGINNLVFTLIKVVSGQIFVTVTLSFYIFSFVLSVIHLIILALDRWVSVTFPLKHKIYWKIRHAKRVVVVLWILAAIISGVIFYDLNLHSCVAGGIQHWVIPVLTTILVGADSILVILYSLVFYQISKQKKRRAKISQSSRSSTNRAAQDRKLKSAFLLCVLTTLAFIFCTSRFTYQLLTHSDKWPDFYSSVLLVTNSFLNSFIYFFHGKISQLLTRKRVRAAAVRYRK